MNVYILNIWNYATDRSYVFDVYMNENDAKEKARDLNMLFLKTNQKKQASYKAHLVIE